VRAVGCSVSRGYTLWTCQEAKLPADLRASAPRGSAQHLGARNHGACGSDGTDTSSDDDGTRRRKSLMVAHEQEPRTNRLRGLGR